MHKAILPAAGLLLVPCIAAAQPPVPGLQASPALQAPPAKSSRPNDCRFVVASEAGATPYKLCLTRAEWTEKLKSDGKDANRLVCHYEDSMGNRFKAYKLCMSAAQWDRRRMDDREAVDRLQRGAYLGRN